MFVSTLFSLRHWHWNAWNYVLLIAVNVYFLQQYGDQEGKWCLFFFTWDTDTETLSLFSVHLFMYFTSIHYEYCHVKNRCVGQSFIPAWQVCMASTVHTHNLCIILWCQKYASKILCMHSSDSKDQSLLLMCRSLLLFIAVLQVQEWNFPPAHNLFMWQCACVRYGYMATEHTSGYCITAQ